ncbi:hypothetical protein Bca52824_048090 [Brassica carinata]|uniref:Uncharacterized protein n=1 Tax=Brassica carinata TaxID=52824 RepID=A0A8X7UTY6_BRACI|nr:hypothetical protein Bca52824_048090 [Brassica carinata]
MKEEKFGTDDDEDVDDPEKPSQQIKGNRRSQRKGKRSQKQGNLRTDDDKADDPKTPSQEKQVKGNRKSRRQGMMVSKKQEKGSSTTNGVKATDKTLKSRKKMRQTKD